MQSQINNKQNIITGAASTITTTNLSPNFILGSSSAGKVGTTTLTVAQINNYQTQIDTLDARVTTVDNRVTTVTNNLATTNSNLSSLTTRVDNLDIRVTNVNNTLTNSIGIVDARVTNLS